MWYDDYELPEPSEVDNIVQEALNKLEEYLIDHSRLNINQIIESASSWENKYRECKTENRKFFSMITERDDQIKELKAELERKRTQLGILPFEPGEEVYFICQSYSDTETFNCPKCSGKGRVKIVHEGTEYTSACPICKDSTYGDHPLREASFHPWKIFCRQIDSITQVVEFNKKTKETEVTVTYKIDGWNVTNVDYIRKKVPGGNLTNEPFINELKTIADELNSNLRDECMKKVGREVTENESKS